MLSDMVSPFGSNERDQLIVALFFGNSQRSIGGFGGVWEPIQLCEESRSR
jgi:hypothetical protein